MDHEPQKRKKALNHLRQIEVALTSPNILTNFTPASWGY